MVLLSQLLDTNCCAGAGEVLGLVASAAVHIMLLTTSLSSHEQVVDQTTVHASPSDHFSQHAQQLGVQLPQF